MRSTRTSSARPDRAVPFEAFGAPGDGHGSPAREVLDDPSVERHAQRDRRRGRRRGVVEDEGQVLAARLQQPHLDGVARGRHGPAHARPVEEAVEEPAPRLGRLADVGRADVRAEHQGLALAVGRHDRGGGAAREVGDDARPRRRGLEATPRTSGPAARRPASAPAGRPRPAAPPGPSPPSARPSRGRRRPRPGRARGSRLRRAPCSSFHPARASTTKRASPRARTRAAPWPLAAAGIIVGSGRTTICTNARSRAFRWSACTKSKGTLVGKRAR